MQAGQPVATTGRDHGPGADAGEEVEGLPNGDLLFVLNVIQHADGNDSARTPAIDAQYEYRTVSGHAPTPDLLFLFPIVKSLGPKSASPGRSATGKGGISARPFG